MPALAENTLYIGGAVYQEPIEKAGLIALKTNNGAITGRKWNIPIDTTLAAGGSWYGVASSPIVSNDKIFFGALDGKVYAVQQ
jgi:outer membrane protein assembly factor BamB